MTEEKKQRGPPKSDDSLRNQTSITVRCSFEQQRRWQAASAATGESVSKITRDLLDNHATEVGVDA